MSTGVIFRLSVINGFRIFGLYYILPEINQKNQIDIPTKTVNIEPQETVTADSAIIRINTVLLTPLKP